MPYIFLTLLAAFFVGCDGNSGRSSTASLAWSIPAPPDVGGANGQPISDGERFFTTGARALVAFDVSTGQQVWSASPLRSLIPRYGAISNGRILTTDDEAVALDAHTGREIWRIPLGSSGALSEHGADGDAFYVGTRDRVVRALDAATGAERWRADLGPDWFGGIARGVRVADGVAYAAVERTYPPNGFLSQGIIVALDAQTGREIWRYENGDGSTSRAVVGAPVVAGSVLLIADQRDGAFIAVERTTGRERWRVKTREGFAGPSQPPVVVDGGTDGLAYGAARDLRVYAIDIATGQMRWAREPVPDNSSGYFHAVCGSAVLHSADRVFALDRSSGRTVSPDVYRQDVVASGFAVAGKRAFFIGERTVAALDCP